MSIHLRPSVAGAPGVQSAEPEEVMSGFGMTLGSSLAPVCGDFGSLGLGMDTFETEQQRLQASLSPCTFQRLVAVLKCLATW